MKHFINFVIIFFISTEMLSAQINNVREKDFINIFGEEEFRTLDQRARNVFDGKGFIEVQKALYKAHTKFKNDLDEIGPIADFLIAEDEEWQVSKKFILKLYPDFFKKTELKIDRFLVAQFIKEYFELEKDLKKWPDLLTNMEKFKERLAIKTQFASLAYLRENQNKDGSYGEKNKIYCTSFALLTFLSHGETTTSFLYSENIKKAINFLNTQAQKSEIDDMHILLWAVSEYYAMTGIASSEKSMNTLYPAFIKDFSWEVDKDPKRFFLNNLILKSCYVAGGKSPFFNNLKKRFSSLKKNGSPYIAASKALWNFGSVRVNAELKQKGEQSLEEVLMVYQLQEKATNNHQAFKQIEREYFADKLKIKLDQEKFSKNEQKLLNTIFPSFIYCYLYPKYLPSSKKLEPDKISEDLNLVD